MKEELLKGLSKEQIVKLKACKNQEEMLSLAKEEGIELSDEQLEAVSGGACSLNKDNVCPKCGCNSCRSCGDREDFPNGQSKIHYFCWYCHNDYYIIK